MLRTAIAVFLLCLLVLPAQAQRTQTFGPYQIHFNAFSSMQLQEAMARSYGVQRSRARGVLVIALQHEGESADGFIRVTASDGDGRQVPVELRRLRSGDHVSYLGTFRIEDGATIRFRLEASPFGSEEVLHAGFSQQFFIE